LVILVVMLFSLKVESQSIVWYNVLAGQQEEYGNAICLDANHNIITTGSFQDICYGGSFGLFSSGLNDILYKKHRLPERFSGPSNSEMEILIMHLVWLVIAWEIFMSRVLFLVLFISAQIP